MTEEVKEQEDDGWMDERVSEWTMGMLIRSGG